MTIVLKDKNLYPVCKFIRGMCSCKSNYIGETKRNVQTRWNENKDFEPAKHLFQFSHGVLGGLVLHILRSPPPHISRIFDAVPREWRRDQLPHILSFYLIHLVLDKKLTQNSQTSNKSNTSLFNIYKENNLDIIYLSLIHI